MTIDHSVIGAGLNVWGMTKLTIWMVSSKLGMGQIKPLASVDLHTKIVHPIRTQILLIN